MAALENQANQIRLQAAQEAERLGKEKAATLQLLQKVRRGPPLEGIPGGGWEGSQGPALRPLPHSERESAPLTAVPFLPDRKRMPFWPWRDATGKSLVALASPRPPPPSER